MGTVQFGHIRPFYRREAEYLSTITVGMRIVVRQIVSGSTGEHIRIEIVGETPAPTAIYVIYVIQEWVQFPLHRVL